MTTRDDGTARIELDADDGATLVLIVPGARGTYDVRTLAADAAVLTQGGRTAAATFGTIEVTRLAKADARGSFTLAFDDPAAGSVDGSFSTY